MTSQIRGAAVAALAALAALAAWAPPALATGPDGDAVDAAETAAKASEIAVGPSAGDVPFRAATGGSDSAAAKTADVVVVAPMDASDPITLGTTDEEMPDIGISLPATASAEEADVVDGDTVYVDDRTDTSFVVDAQADGARIMSVLHSAESPREIAYDLDLPEGTELLERSNGSFDVAYVAEGVEVVVGTVEAPWAVDAEGRSLRTNYEVIDNTLIQAVDVGPGTAFPVTADPSVRLRWFGATVYFSRSETGTLAFGAGACALLGKALTLVPFVGVALAGKLADIYCTGVALMAANAWRQGKCMRAHVYAAGGLTPWYGTC